MIPVDAILVVSFGGPEGPDEVMPFLRNVVKGKNVPDERLLSVADHYGLFHGVSPINEQNRRLISALRNELDQHQIKLPIYWGNRNWHPLLTDTLKEMKRDGVKRGVAFVTSAYSSYSGCRQYREDIERARTEAGDNAPLIDKLKVFYNQPGFIQANEERLREALAKVKPEDIGNTHVAFTAHSIPMSMAKGCRYQNQLLDVARSVASSANITNWQLVFQSRSGPATQPWLEPDINDHIRALHASGVRSIVVAPIGFVSDHMEIVYDLDSEALQLCSALGMTMVRAATVGTHPAFISMIRELIIESMNDLPAEYHADAGNEPELCAVTCCSYS